MAVPLRQGRFFTYAEQNQPVAIVNEEFVHRFMRGQDPIGRRFSPGASGSKMNWHIIAEAIIGVLKLRVRGQPHAARPLHRTGREQHIEHPTGTIG